MLFKRLTGAKPIKKQEGVTAPPGQYVTEKWPIMTFDAPPRIDLDTWRFDIFGLVDEEKSLNWEVFVSLPKVTIDAEFHCVTQWSRLENTWEGVSFSEVMGLVDPKPEASHIMVHCFGGYTTNLALDVLNDDDVLFAYNHDGAPLDRDHGDLDTGLCGWSCPRNMLGRAPSGSTASS